MRFALFSAAAALPALVLAADAPSSQDAVYTGTADFGLNTLPASQRIAALISQGVKPAAATYYETVGQSNDFLGSAFEALATETGQIIVSGAQVTAAPSSTNDPLAGFQYLQAGITNVPEQYRSVLSSVYGEVLQLQTGKAAAAPRQTNLALSAAVAGVVGGVAGMAVAL